LPTRLNMGTVPDFASRHASHYADATHLNTEQATWEEAEMSAHATAAGLSHSARYTRVAMLLHWLIALLMIANIALGLSFARVSDDMVRPLIDLHKSIGITVLGLAILRLLWRATHRPPPLPPTYPRWEQSAAHWAHWALYGLIFALPLTGWLHDSAWGDAATHPVFLYGLIYWPRIWFVMGPTSPMQDHLHDTLGTVHIWFG
jgi:cytochrome b561